MTVESSHAQPSTASTRPHACAPACASARTGSSSSQFCAVGATGYFVNLAVYTVLLDAAGLHYISAAVGSFLVAVTNNYAWNRIWTFRAQRGHVGHQGVRFFLVSAMALVANLAVLHTLVTLGLGEFVAQAIAIVLVTPVNFVGNKLWSFGPRS